MKYGTWLRSLTSNDSNPAVDRLGLGFEDFIYFYSFLLLTSVSAGYSLALRFWILKEIICVIIHAKISM